MTVAYDELPGVSVSCMRALGEITAEMKVTTVTFDEVSFSVGLALVCFANGGSWSFFLCPCGRRARILRLYEGGLASRRPRSSCAGGTGLACQQADGFDGAEADRAAE
jgi:hypothetical protein